jgi:hypothetical protein
MYTYKKILSICKIGVHKIVVFFAKFGKTMLYQV